MKKLLISIIAGLLTSCIEEPVYVDRVSSNAEKVFGVTFSPNQDWRSADNGELVLTGLNATKVQILALIGGELKVLNEASYHDGLKLSYDAPKGCELYILLDGKTLEPLEGFDLTRSLSGIQAPNDTPTITDEVIPYERQRSYNGFSTEKLYITSLTPIPAPDYTQEFKKVLRAVIFTYLPNGKKYHNLDKIKNSGYYNDNCYALTTGDDPILVSPIYKNDGGYGEVVTSELYYYYFKGDLSINEIKALPKYRAIQLSNSILDDDSLAKHHTYALAYFGDSEPTSSGSYKFPKDYKIGFMLRMNFEDDVKKGELYFDGRLNKDINKHGHFASSKLGDSDPRMCWITANKKVFFSVEAGTDSDFNDIIFEVEGGVTPIDVPIIPEYNDYVFLFEDRDAGDYDMNDVVVRGKRLDETHVQYDIMAAGAHDELYLLGLNGKIINSRKEIHSYFGVTKSTFINVGDTIDHEFISEVFTVDKKFSFLDNPISVFNRTTNKEIKISQTGSDPHAIMIPYKFKWPIEKLSINKVYTKFNDWGANPVVSTDWYLYYNQAKVTQY